MFNDRIVTKPLGPRLRLRPLQVGRPCPDPRLGLRSAAGLPRTESVFHTLDCVTSVSPWPPTAKNSSPNSLYRRISLKSHRFRPKILQGVALVVVVILFEAQSTPVAGLGTWLVQIYVNERMAERASSTVAGSDTSLHQADGLLGNELDGSQWTRLECLGRLLEARADHRLGAATGATRSAPALPKALHLPALHPPSAAPPSAAPFQRTPEIFQRAHNRSPAEKAPQRCSLTERPVPQSKWWHGLVLESC